MAALPALAPLLHLDARELHLFGVFAAGPDFPPGKDAGTKAIFETSADVNDRRY